MSGSDASSGASALLFLYGTLKGGGLAAPLLEGCEKVGEGSVPGELHDVGGRFPAAILRGDERVHGEIWSCPEAVLPALDRYEAVQQGLFRRVQTTAGTRRCWIYVAGPALEPQLGAPTRLASGRWDGRPSR